MPEEDILTQRTSKQAGRQTTTFGLVPLLSLFNPPFFPLYYIIIIKNEFEAILKKKMASVPNPIKRGKQQF
jgi:hypothetical protein